MKHKQSYRHHSNSPASQKFPILSDHRLVPEKPQSVIWITNQKKGEVEL